MLLVEELMAVYSYEIQDYLEKRSYKLTLEEYYDIVNNSHQISHVKLEMIADFYHKKLVETNDGYSWGIYILNYNADKARLKDIVF